MSKKWTRRDFLQRGTAVVASGPFGLHSVEWRGQGEAETLTVDRYEVGASAFTEGLRRFAEDPSRRPPGNLEWFGHNFLSAHFDIGITDSASEGLSNLNPSDIVATVADSGSRALSFYVQGPSGWLFYPSKIGQQHPLLRGRDIIAECLAACRKQGLKFTGYFVPNEMGVEVTRHPEWRVELVGSDVPTSPRLWGNLCFNRPGCWPFYLAILHEAVAKYEMDAAWFDNLWCRQCGCAYCQKRYQEETGLQLPFYTTPRGVNYPAGLAFGHNYPDRSEFSRYFSHIQMWINEWNADLRRTVKEARPNCAVEVSYLGGGWGGDHGFTIAYNDAGDFITTDFGTGQFRVSLESKSLRGYSQHLPFVAPIPIAEAHGDETSPKQEGLLKQEFSYVLASGGVITSIDTMNWRGSISKTKYKRTARIGTWASERFPYLGGVMVSDVGLYFSLESNIYYPKWHNWRWGDANQGVSLHDAGNMAFVQAMIRENIPFDVLHRNRLRDLGRHKVLYMNNVEVLSDDEGQALSNFVKNGGGLVITHRTGMRDHRFQERKNFLLADLMGADYLEEPNLATSFIMVSEQDRTEGFFPSVDSELAYFDVRGPQCYVNARENTRCLGRIARPRRAYNEDGFPGIRVIPPVMQLIDPKEVRQVSIGFLYQPEIVTSHPAVVLNRVEKGRVVYCGANPSCDDIDDLHDFIVALVKWAAGGKLDATVTSNAPGPVEIITMEQLSQNRTVIHGINGQSGSAELEIDNVDVAIKTFGRKPKAAFAVDANSDIGVRSEGGMVYLTFPRIKVWETVVIQWEEV